MTRTTYFDNWLRRHRSEKLLLLLTVSLVLLPSCVAPPSYDSGATLPPADGIGSPVESDTSTAPYTPQPSPSETDAASAQFNFPLASCGDRSSEPSETWYSVFVDGGNVDDIRSRYCGDAISTTREQSGTATVQVASFTSYSRALSLAKAIGGVVEQTAQAAPSGAGSSGTYQNAERADPAPSQANPQPETPPVQTGQTAFLNTSESGVPVNIRATASTSAQVQSTGFAGDRVQIANQAQGDDGYTWYEVRLESGATGWVRGDLIATQMPNASQPAPQTPAYNQSPTYNQPPAYNQPATKPPPATAQSPYNPEPGYNQPPYAQSPYSQAPYSQSPYSQAPYSQAPYSQPPGYGQAPPSDGRQPYGRNSTLMAREPGAMINIRESASMDSRVRYRANPGDPVQVSGSAQGDDGYTWYQVRFSSGAIGWVRGDLVQ